MSRPAPLAALFLLAATALPAVLAAADDYPIRLQRPVRVGQRTEETGQVSVHKRLVATLAGKKEETLNELKFSVHYEITCKVLETGKDGGATSIETTITKFVQKDDKREKVLLRPGVVVISRLVRARTVHKIVPASDRQRADTELPMEAQVAMDNIISLRADGEPTIDDRLGTKDRKKTGDAWPVNAGAIEKKLQAGGRKVTAKDITGQTKLIAAAPRGNMKCLELRTELQIANIPIARADYPPEATKGTRTATVKSTTWLPLNLALPAVAEDVEQTVTEDFETPHGSVRGHLLITSSATYTPVK